MKNFALLFLTSVMVLALSSENAFAVAEKTLVIFDIDDTIKISHVLDTLDAIIIAPETSQDVAFPQMSDLANALKKDLKNVVFHYVSNAPLPMEATHALFLYRNDFPSDGLHMNTYMTSGNNHKITTITQIIEETHPTKLLMIGDNGERDVQVYDFIRNRYSSTISMSTYIHMLYNEKSGGKKLFPGQKGFVSAKQLALDLAQDGFLTQDSALKILKDNTFEQDAVVIQRNSSWIGFSSLNGITNSQLSMLRIGLPLWADCSMFNSSSWSGFGLSYVFEYLHLRGLITQACTAK